MRPGKKYSKWVEWEEEEGRKRILLAKKQDKRYLQTRRKRKRRRKTTGKGIERIRDLREGDKQRMQGKGTNLVFSHRVIES